MLGSVRPMSQSTPLACPHSIRAFPGGRPGSGLRGRREVEVRLSTNSHPPGLTAAAIRPSTAGPYPAIWCSKARQVTRSYALSGSSVVEPVGLVWLVVAVVRYVAKRRGQAEASRRRCSTGASTRNRFRRGRPSAFSLAASVRAGVVGSSPAPGRRRLIERLDLVPSQREGERFGIAGCLSPVLRTGDR